MSPGPGDGYQAVSTDGFTTLQPGVMLEPLAQNQGPPLLGTATVRLSPPDPYQIVKYAEFGVQVGELSAGFVLTQQVQDRPDAAAAVTRLRLRAPGRAELAGHRPG